MKLKKSIAFLAALTFAVTAFVGCGEKEDKDDDKDSKTTSAAAESKEETKEEASSEDAAADTSSEETGDASADASADDASSEEAVTSTADDSMDLSAMFNEVTMPATDAADSAEADFVGKWECYCMGAEGAAYDSIMGMPLYAMIHIEIKADGTGEVASLSGADASAPDVTTLTWKYDSNGITVDSDGETLKGVITSEGYLLFTSEDSSDVTQLFLKKVDEYTEFDMESFTNDLAASFGIESDAATAE